MKSADNHTKRKALVEAFFYRELVSHGRITIPPQGSFLAGQKYTQPWHTDYDMHVCTHIMTKTQRHHLFTHTRSNTARKKMFECVSFPHHSLVHSLCLCLVEKKDVSHSALPLNHYPPVNPSVHLIFQSVLPVRLLAGVILCSPFILAENISMWSRTHLSEPDGCLSNCHSPLPHLLCSRLNTKKDNGH